MFFAVAKRKADSIPKDMFGNPLKPKDTIKSTVTTTTTATVTDEDNDRLFNAHTAATTKQQSETRQIQASIDNLPWVEKYRPSGLNELISHTDIINTINKLIDANKLPHLLFYGPPGTGMLYYVMLCYLTAELVLCTLYSNSLTVIVLCTHQVKLVLYWH